MINDSVKQIQAAVAYAKKVIAKRNGRIAKGEAEPITLYTHEISR